ncbi:MAG: TatD family hydrolase [Pirellulales bacterium]|nr:TatD family hydrolase [Pirellulales bacterium]
MYFIEPHIHIASRTTDDLQAMARAGCVAVGEPAFWMGYDRTSVGSFYDYFRQLTEWEPTRTARYGMRHFTWIGVNAKEAENVSFAREVMEKMPEFLDLPDVLGVGEIGLNKCTSNEVATLTALIDIALERGEMMLFHTPHLEHKLMGTRMILDLLRNDNRVNRDRVWIDHCEEHTIRQVRDEGYWAGLTLYPTTKVTPERAVDMVEIYGPERLLVTSSADWGPSDPLAIIAFMAAMRSRGHDESLIRRIVYDNPLEFMRQCERFKFGAPQ